jgi:molybdopterin adenylyltransferase
MSHGIDPLLEFVSLHIAVLTVSDSRTLATDKSGDALVAHLTAAGHKLAARSIVADSQAIIESQLRAWIAAPAIEVILITGGTGVTGRDVTPEAVHAVMEKAIVGFGELFRWLSYADIGTSTIQSRAIGALANGTYIFAMPGSTGACNDAWNKILVFQLDSRHRPCNFAELLPRLAER